MRKSPIKHQVRQHKHMGKTVKTFTRGKGQKLINISNPTITKSQLKHYVIKYKAIHKNGTLNYDTTNVYVLNKKDLIKELQKDYIGTPPKIEIVWAELQAPSAPRLKPLLDIDSRTRNRMNRGYILDNISISDINLEPVRSSIRFNDNYKQMKATKSVPPVHLSPTPDLRFNVEDGVHRIHSAIKLGYKSIPALILYGD